MTNKNGHTLKVGETLHIILWKNAVNGARAYTVPAKIIEINEENQTIFVQENNSINHSFTFLDFNRLIFETELEAIKAVELLSASLGLF